MSGVPGNAAPPHPLQGRHSSECRGHLLPASQGGHGPGQEAQFSGDAADWQGYHLWADKYRPRKPRFFNRVHTGGFEWNKYNQASALRLRPTHHPRSCRATSSTSSTLISSTKRSTPEYFLEACADNKVSFTRSASMPGRPTRTSPSRSSAASGSIRTATASAASSPTASSSSGSTSNATATGGDGEPPPGPHDPERACAEPGSLPWRGLVFAGGAPLP